MSDRTGAVEATAEWRAIIDSLRVCAVNAGDEHFEKHGMRFTIRPTEAKALLEAVSQPEQREPDAWAVERRIDEREGWTLYGSIVPHPYYAEDLAGRIRKHGHDARVVAFAKLDTPPVSQHSLGNSEVQTRERDMEAEFHAAGTLRHYANVGEMLANDRCTAAAIDWRVFPSQLRNAAELLEAVAALRTGVSAQPIEPRIKTRLSKREDGMWEAQWVRVFDNHGDALAALEGVSAQPERTEPRVTCVACGRPESEHVRGFDGTSTCGASQPERVQQNTPEEIPPTFVAGRQVVFPYEGPRVQQESEQP